MKLIEMFGSGEGDPRSARGLLLFAGYFDAIEGPAGSGHSEICQEDDSDRGRHRRPRCQITQVTHHSLTTEQRWKSITNEL